MAADGSIKCETLTIDEASEILKVSKPTARKILGEPYDIELNKKGLPKFLYLKCKVETEKNLLECQRCNQPEKGLRKCRSCPHYFRKNELVSGKCTDCRCYDL